MSPAARRIGPSVALLALAVGVASPASAQDRRQFRKLELTDGRTLTAEILSTEPTGLMLRTPQGDSLISFEVLRDMSPTDELTYKSQTDWLVYIDLPDRLEPTAVELLGAIEGIDAATVGQTFAGLRPEQAAEARACDGTIGCIADAVKGAPWMWIVTARDDAHDGALRSGLSSGGSRSSTPLESESRDALWTSLHESLGLQAPNTGAPKPTKSTSSSGAPFTKEKVAAFSFIPLPGAPSLAMKDGGNAALAWGIAVPAAGAFAGASYAAASDSPGEMVGMMAGGFYVATVFANQITGMLSLKAQGVVLAPVPMEHGGGVVLAGSLR